MSKQTRWTLKSIAKELGVSNATVSNAFNRPDQLSAKRRDDILAACKTLGYYGPNKAAQSLRSGTFNIVALVLPDNLNNVVDFVDGFICYGRPRNNALVEQLKTVSKHVVTIDFDIARNASVNINNEQASYEIAKHVLKNQSDKVAILGLRLLDENVLCRVYEHHEFETGQSISHQRLRGYQRALSEANITVADDRIWNIPESSERFANIAAKEVLSASPRPNVIICMSDLIALATMREAIKQGIKIGEELRIVGFDGIDEAARFVPRLTTIHQNSQEKGVMAAELFISKEEKICDVSYELDIGASG